jgi:hypothetical protein
LPQAKLLANPFGQPLANQGLGDGCHLPQGKNLGRIKLHRHVLKATGPLPIQDAPAEIILRGELNPIGNWKTGRSQERLP